MTMKGLEAEKRRKPRLKRVIEMPNLMHCVAKQHYGVVVNREPSFLFYTGGPPHQQSVLQSYEQPANIKQLLAFSLFSVCAHRFVCLCVCVIT